MGVKEQRERVVRWARRPPAEVLDRIAELEEQVSELRSQSLRVAELADLVQELLIPMAQRDEERIEAAIAAYSKAL